MTHPTMKRCFVALLAATLTGCGSCESGTQTGQPSAPAPAQKEAPPAQQPAAPPAEQPAAAAPTPEADCFVLVDAEPDFGSPPMKVQFETDVECTGSPVTFSWDFGDGTKGGNEANPVHVYEKPGEYVAVVKVTAPDGGEGEDEIDITVDEDLDE
jgi:PKD repeat protein